jgi:hypothetical protein
VTARAAAAHPAGGPRRAAGFWIRLALTAWLATLAFDFLLNAGILAGLWLEPSPFLLPPAVSFARIPAGYVSFLVFDCMLLWLGARLGISGALAGARLGLGLGFLLNAAWLVGLYSISTAPPAVLLAWLVGQAAQLGVAGAVIGSGLASGRLGRIFAVVVVGAVLAIAAVVILQTAGVAPAAKLR